MSTENSVKRIAFGGTGSPQPYDVACMGKVTIVVTPFVSAQGCSKNPNISLQLFL